MSRSTETSAPRPVSDHQPASRPAHRLLHTHTVISTTPAHYYTFVISITASLAAIYLTLT